jgi:hypothetical protein
VSRKPIPGRTVQETREFNRHLKHHIGRREGTPKKKNRQSKKRRRRTR